MDVQTLADRIEINDLLTRYAHAVDSKDWALYRTVFTNDAHIDYESAGGIKGDLERPDPLWNSEDAIRRECRRQAENNEPQDARCAQYQSGAQTTP